MRIRNLLLGSIFLCLVACPGSRLFAQFAYTTISDPDADPTNVGTTPTGISGTNIVGSYIDASGNTNGFLYNGSSYITLNDPNAAIAGGAGTTPQAISGNLVAGWYVDDLDNHHGFTYNISTATYTTLDDPNASTDFEGTLAFGISGSKVVGQYQDASGNNYGFLYNGSTYTTLSDPLADASIGGTNPTAISGTNIVGNYVDGSDNTNGFLYNGSTYTTVDDPNAVEGTFLIGISGSTALGYYQDASDFQYDFLYNIITGTYSPINLADPLDPSGDDLASAFYGGDFVGTYSDDSGNQYGFLATPVPEPSLLALLPLATPLLFARPKSRRRGRL